MAVICIMKTTGGVVILIIEGGIAGRGAEMLIYYGLETFYISWTFLLLIICTSPFTSKSHFPELCALASHDFTRSSVTRCHEA